MLSFINVLTHILWSQGLVLPLYALGEKAEFNLSSVRFGFSNLYLYR